MLVFVLTRFNATKSLQGLKKKDIAVGSRTSAVTLGWVASVWVAAVLRALEQLRGAASVVVALGFWTLV